MAGGKVMNYDAGGFVLRLDSNVNPGLQGSTDFKVAMRCPPNVEVYAMDGEVDHINGTEGDDGYGTNYPDGNYTATNIRVHEQNITPLGYGSLNSGNGAGPSEMWEDVGDERNEEWIWHWTADAEI